MNKTAIKSLSWSGAVGATILGCWAVAAMLYAGRAEAGIHWQPVPHDKYEPGSIAENIAFHEGRVKRDPEGAIGWQMLGNAYLARARESDSYEMSVKAEAAARRSLSIRTKRNFAACKLLVNSLLQQHRFKDALQEADTGLTENTDDPQAQETKAETLLEVGRYGDAEKQLAQDHEIADDTEALSVRARLLEVRGDTAGALGTMRQALALAEKNAGVPATALAWFHSRIGMMLEGCGQDEEADGQFQASLHLYPRDYKAWAGRARIAFRRGDWQATVRLGETSNSIAPMADVAGMIGDAETRLGHTHEAQLQFARVAVLAGMPSGVSDGMHEFAAAAAKIGVHGHRLDRQYAMFCADHRRDLDGAYASCLRDLQERQDSLGFDALAWVSRARGDLTEADLAAKRALASGTHDPKVWFHAAVIARDRGDIKASENYLASAKLFGLRPDPIQKEQLVALR